VSSSIASGPQHSTGSCQWPSCVPVLLHRNYLLAKAPGRHHNNAVHSDPTPHLAYRSRNTYSCSSLCAARY
jgi:hypothetical protein